MRYRVQNHIGWSDFSPISSFVAADIPSKPTPPIMISVTASEI
jgi:hypothetical protein